MEIITYKHHSLLKKKGVKKFIKIKKKNMTSFEFVLSIFFRWKFIKSYFFLNIENMKIKKIMI